MVGNAIKVYARLKPERNRKDVVAYQVFHRPNENVEEDVFQVLSPGQKCKDYADNRPVSWNFSFFRVLEESATQAGVFENVARPVVESALDGYNGTIFAYGQTASGKTFTITGNEEAECRGIVPRSLQYLFEAIEKRPGHVYTVEVAYLEIYNETGYDLLDRRQPRDLAVTRTEDLPRITLMEDETGKLHARNLSFHCVETVDEAVELLQLGNDNRIVAETPMNPRSSRSHCIFTIVVSAKEFGADQYKRAKVHLVDLAGSERVYKCSISGTILTEAKHINLSLHYLEQVIVCLGQESTGHIPYRNSLLTSILRDSLGGNCLTTMLATLSLDIANMEETLSTCRFAQRVALIRNDVKLNLESDIQSENALLRAENERLRRQIRALTNGPTTTEELSAEDKRHLDRQIRIFLETSERITWDCSPRKVQYCFESVKRAFELNRDPDGCWKKIQYYKDLVMQRDQEISLLIDMMKKAGCQRSSASSDSEKQDCTESQGKISSAKKQKQRAKSSKLTIRDAFGKRDEIALKIGSEEDSCETAEVVEPNVPVAKDANRTSPIDRISMQRSIAVDNPKANVSSPCSIVNLPFDDSTSDKKKTIDRENGMKQDETKRHRARARGERKEKIGTETKASVPEFRVEAEIVERNDKASAPREMDHSVPVYEKVWSFNNYRPAEKSARVKENSPLKDEDSTRVSDSVENCRQFENLPLTGDPDIDEEIIAFYKAKRSGAAY